MSDEKPFPFRLVNVFFLRTVVEAVPGWDVDAENALLSPANQIGATVADDKKSVICNMRTTFNPERVKDAPYFVDLECVVNFEVVDPSISMEELKRGATITGHNVAYGAIREAVLWVTARHVYGPLTLGLSLLKGKSPEASKEASGGKSNAAE